MRLVVCILLFFVPDVLAIVQKDGISKNSFIHIYTESGEEYKRRVVFSGYTFLQNMSRYIFIAENEKQKSAKHDDKIDIEIAHIQVIKLNGDPCFDDLIAYIITTKDGRCFFKYQIRLRRLVYTIPKNMLGRFMPEPGSSMMGDEFLTPGLHAGVRVTGTLEDMNEHLRRLPSSMNNTEFHYLVWVTTQITPATETWNIETQRINFDNVVIGYSVIEEAGFL